MVQKIKSSNLDADVLTGNAELAEAANNSDTVLVHDTSAGALKKIQVSNLTAQAGDGLSKTNSTLAVDINGTTELSEIAADADFILVYDTSAGALKKVLRSNFTIQVPTISSVSPTNAVSGDGTGNYTFTITGTGFTGGSASLINESGSGVNFDSVTVDSATQITGVIAKSSLPGSGEPYDVKVTGSSGLTTTLTDQINVDQQPVFSTAAGSLATITEATRTSAGPFTIAAADPESGGDVTYTLESGSLPAGLSGSSTSSGYIISGTPTAVGSNTTSNFTIRAADVNSNTSDRAFSITVNAPQTQSFTSSGTFSVPSGTTAVNVLVVAGGGSGGNSDSAATGDYGGGGGGGAGGLIYRPGFPVTPGGTVTVTVGCGGAASPSYATRGSGGQDSVFGTLTAKGGGAGGAGSPNTNAHGTPGGSGGGYGSGLEATITIGSATQPTQPGDSGTYGFGNPGGGRTSGEPSVNSGGGGGGGAGAAGGQSNPVPGGGPQVGGTGGVGKAYTIADGTTSVYYAGGGAGGFGGGKDGCKASGGQGGGGQGGGSGQTAQSGQANTGGGGGGATECTGFGNNAGQGGKGIVIVQY